MRSLEERRRAFSDVVQELPTIVSKYRSPEWRAARRRNGWAVADRGGNISDFAHVEGVECQTMVQWLKANDPDLHGALNDASHPMTLPRHKRLERLIIVRDGKASGRRTHEIAAMIGISRNRLRSWLKKWAPDGIDQAIEDESFDELDDSEVAA